jgi:hypothetical protein
MERHKGGGGSKGKGAAVMWLFSHSMYTGDDCLIFPFFRNPETGYGSFGYCGEMLYAHRFMCELVNGPPSEEKPHASHNCGNGHLGCVNPNHLKWKTVSGNLLDRREHGTARRNEKGRFGGLTEDEVGMIRALKGIARQWELAIIFGVKRPAIQYWQRHDRPRSKPSENPSAIKRREAASRFR